MSPLYLSMFLIVLTAAAAAVEWQRRGRAHRALKRLAVERHLHFSPHDQLRLADRVAAAFPVPGAAYVGVVDLLYGSQDGFYRYVFTAQYTVGAVRSKKRVRRAATFTEPRERSKTSHCCAIKLGSPELSLVEQYNDLLSNEPH
jgi:hypothetical protein